LLVGLAVGTQYRAEGRANEESQAAQANGTKEANGTSYGTSQDARKVTSVVMAVVCQVAVAVLLMLICRIHFQDTPAGAGSALLYLMLPSTAYHFELSIHVWPTALLLGAVLAYRRPAVAGGLLGLAAGTALFPVFLFPAWFQFYRDRGGLLFFRWFGLVGIVAFAGTFTILATLGNVTAGVWQTPNLADWQPWKVPTAQSVWTGAHWAYRLPIFVTFVGLVIGTLIWPAVRNLGQLIAVSAAVVIGL